MVWRFKDNNQRSPVCLADTAEGDSSTIMEAEKVIKYVHRNFRTYWRTVCRLDCDTFGALLGLKDPGLTHVEYSRLTSTRDKTPRRVLAVLSDPQVQRGIAAALKCPQLFQCKSEAELDTLMDLAILGERRVNQPRPASDLVLIPQPLHEAGMELHAREERAIKSLLNLILAGSRSIVCWPDPPTLGPAFLAYMLAGTFLPKEGVSAAYLIRPFAGYSTVSNPGSREAADARPFEQALQELCRHMGLEGRPSASRILRALEERRAVLFVLHASFVPEPSRTEPSTIWELIREAGANFVRRSGPARLVLLGSPPVPLAPGRAALASDLRQTLAFGNRTDKERSVFFEAQWRRFCRLRHDCGPDEIAGRLQQAREQYSTDADTVMWPSTIRMLAFFASNQETFSCFDPTGGWSQLASMPLQELPIDIRLYLDEAYVQVSNIPGSKRRPALRAARWCSTAVFWLTEDAVADFDKLPPRMTLDGFKAGVEKVPHLINIASEDRNKPVYKVDLALRALIQDLWRVENPFDRARAHYQIAKRMFESRDDKELLNVEFPVEPHWGRSRIHFLAETLRHLVRTCDHVQHGTEPRQSGAQFSGKFPAPPSWELKGCDPYEVINFCFAEIFWLQLNGNSRNDNVHNRKLSRQHGAYRLTGELLQLVSDGGVLGKQHWALNPLYVARYFREVAYAQLDLGDLAGAEANFRQLIDLSKADGTVTLDYLDYQLDRVVVLTAMDNLLAAQHCLDAVAALVPTVTLAGTPSVEARRLAKLKTRLAAREAQLKYLRGEFHEAHAIYLRLEHESPRVIVRDVAHTFIATLGALGGTDNLNRAMSICVTNLFENTSRGLHHQALGFRVSLAHLFRKLGMIDVAEATLDQVSHDIRRFGCSERSYLAFLLEEGRISLQKNGAARAYAMYLRPCYERAAFHRYERAARAAGEHAESCLLKLKALFEEAPQPQPPNIKALLEGPKRDSRNTSEDSSEEDLIEMWARRLGSLDAVEEELRNVRCALSPTPALAENAAA